MRFVDHIYIAYARRAMFLATSAGISFQTYAIQFRTIIIAYFVNDWFVFIHKLNTKLK
jgi:hypothetical protein